MIESTTIPSDDDNTKIRFRKPNPQRQNELPEKMYTRCEGEKRDGSDLHSFSRKGLRVMSQVAGDLE